MNTKKKATCRYCKRSMLGDDYMYGNNIHGHKINYFGGYVCSYQCDKQASLDMLSSMPGGGKAKHLDSPSYESLKENWN